MATKILCVLNRLPYPVVGGREKMLCQVLDFMDRSSCEIHLVVFEPKRQWKNLKDRLATLAQKFPKIRQVTLLGLPGSFRILKNILVRTLLLGRNSIQESLFYSRGAAHKLSELTRTWKPDIVYCDSTRTAQFFEFMDTRALKIFDADDLLSKRYRIMETGKGINLLGSFTDKLPRLVKWVGRGIFSRPLVKLESGLMYRRENKLATAFDHVIFVSPVEEAELQNRVKQARIHHIYPTMKTRTLDRPELNNGTRPIIAFMGLLNIPHNQVGLRGFLENIFPRIVAKLPTVQFKIIGSKVPNTIRELAARYQDNILFTGFVENFEDVLKTVHVFVAPIYFGTGIKTKIIDAMSMGLPVVTTPIGAEGLSIQNRENILVAETDEQFAENVIELLTDPALNRKVSQQARTYIEEHHNPDKEAARFREILGLQQG
jgi:glycosyltransferase involved in cell wall biosynthesis